MKTTPVSADDLRRSVLAVPPLARNTDLSINRAENAKLVRHIESGGVTSFIYGGNANLYNVGLYEYAALLDCLEEIAAPETLVIPSAGPDFGKMMDQAPILRMRAFPTAMVLPLASPCTGDGAETGLRRFAEAYGRPIIPYVKSEGYLTPRNCQRLVDDGLVCGIKYAIVRADPAVDPFLSELVDLVDRRYLISGIGERPAPVHLRKFGLASMTSGSVCVAPRGSQLLLKALQAQRDDEADRLRALYLPLEDLRDAHSPIRVLHEAVTLARIADMGPILPLLSNLSAEHAPAVRDAALKLAAADREHVGLAA